MSIEALILGKLHQKAEQRISKTGRPFVTGKVRAATGDGESQFVNVIAIASGGADFCSDEQAASLAGALLGPLMQLAENQGFDAHCMAPVIVASACAAYFAGSL